MQSTRSGSRRQICSESTGGRPGSRVSRFLWHRRLAPPFEPAGESTTHWRVVCPALGSFSENTYFPQLSGRPPFRIVDVISLREGLAASRPQQGALVGVDRGLHEAACGARPYSLPRYLPIRPSIVTVADQAFNACGTPKVATPARPITGHRFSHQLLFAAGGSRRRPVSGRLHLC